MLQHNKLYLTALALLVGMIFEKLEKAMMPILKPIIAAVVNPNKNI